MRKNRMLVRFKMDGCHHCVESQDDWDNLCEQATHKLTPESTIAEIDSDFTDDFLNELNPMTEEGSPLKVQGYPTYIVIVDGMAKPHEGRKTDELMETLLNNKMIQQEFTLMNFFGEISTNFGS
jgi:hypothetical protein